MPNGTHGCTLDLQGPGGERVELVAVDVEGQFIGLSLSEHKGLEMHRVGAELHHLDDIQAMRDSLSAFLARNGR